MVIALEKRGEETDRSIEYKSIRARNKEREKHKQLQYDRERSFWIIVVISFVQRFLLYIINQIETLFLSLEEEITKKQHLSA